MFEQSKHSHIVNDTHTHTHTLRDSARHGASARARVNHANERAVDSPSSGMNETNAAIGEEDDDDDRQPTSEQ